MSTATQLPALSANDERYGEGHDACIRLSDAVRKIEGISNWNGPSGRMLGLAVETHCVAVGKQIGDLTISELSALCKKTAEEYNEIYRRRYGV